MLGAGLLSEAGTVDYHHVLLQNQFLDKHIVALGNIDARIGVERASWRNTTHPRSRIAPLDGQIATAAQLLADFRRVTRRTFERRFDRIWLGIFGAKA